MQDKHSLKYGKNSIYPARRYSYNLRLSMLQQEVKGSSHILDIGSATGDYDIDLKHDKNVIVSLDINMDSLKIASKKGNIVSYLNGDATQLPIKSGSFNNIIILNAFRYFSRPLDAIKECYRILKPGGKLLIIDHNKYCPDTLLEKRYVVKYYSAGEIRKMMITSGFRMFTTLVIPHARYFAKRSISFLTV
jgi:demethylmenaquinone methyltransferase/2-methoxy-6-polyprenyl-1,4-benzoquinol methylase